MCILAPFCSNAAYLSCYNTTFATCEECSLAAFLAFGFIVALLGLTIVATNSLVLWQVVRKKKKATFDKIKASLAVADILSGFQPLVISPYNLHWTMNSTPNEFSCKCIEFRGSLQAIAGGMFYIFGLSSSLYHLVFLSQQRVFAMRWPLKYKVQKARTVYIGLGIVWFLAMLAALAPGFLSDFDYLYAPELFVFAFSLKIATDIITLITIAWVLPFLVMTCFMIYSALLIRKNVRRSKKLTGNNSDQEVHNKREASMLKKVALMQVGFTLTLAPFGISMMINLFPDLFWCRNLALTHIVSCYLIMANSLVNPIIYSFRDKEFRKYIVQCFASKKETFGQRA